MLLLWDGLPAYRTQSVKDFLSAGMKIYKAMADLNADFFIHSGGIIYADGPITEAEIKLEDSIV